MESVYNVKTSIENYIRITLVVRDVMIMRKGIGEKRDDIGRDRHFKTGHYISSQFITKQDIAFHFRTTQDLFNEKRVILRS